MDTRLDQPTTSGRWERTADPVAELVHAAWALAAYIATERDASAASLPDALGADPERTAVLRAPGLVTGPEEAPVTDGALLEGPLAGSAAAARSSALRQALDAAIGTLPPGWSEAADEVLLEQGRASAATGRAIATHLVPHLDGLAARLTTPGSWVLDVGTGVGALAAALAAELPAVRVTGIDAAARAVGLARAQLEGAPGVGGRVEVRHQDVTELAEPSTYDLAWVPAPFLSPRSLSAGLPRVVRALRSGGWLVVGTNPRPAGELAAAVGAWTAVRNGGSATTTAQALDLVSSLGLVDVGDRPTVAGGPVLVLGRVPAGD